MPDTVAACGLCIDKQLTVWAKVRPDRLHEPVNTAALRPFVRKVCPAFVEGNECRFDGPLDKDGDLVGCIVLSGFPCLRFEGAVGDPARLPPGVRQAYAHGALLGLVMFSRRNCPDCGAPLAPRRRLCDDCRRKRRMKAKRDAAARRRARATKELTERLTA